jgi:hypothetical protein
MRLKRKIPSFIFGVSVGLVIGVAFFVFKITDVFDKLKDSAKEQITVIEQPVKTVKTKDTEQKKDSERFKINLSKSQQISYSEVDSLIKQDSKLTIATDELIMVKNIKSINIGDNTTTRDTLAAKLAHVVESNSELYFVEFWKTPLNSKGYKFSKNKIMLYGFQDFNNVLLYQLDNSYYIKCSEQVYKLFYGGDFRQLERVIDLDLLAKIN